MNLRSSSPLFFLFTFDMVTTCNITSVENAVSRSELRWKLPLCQFSFCLLYIQYSNLRKNMNILLSQFSVALSEDNFSLFISEQKSLKNLWKEKEIGENSTIFSFQTNFGKLTLYPFSRSVPAIALPIPWAPPVTMAAFVVMVTWQILSPRRLICRNL